MENFLKVAVEILVIMVGIAGKVPKMLTEFVWARMSKLEFYHCWNGTWFRIEKNWAKTSPLSWIVEES